MNEYEQAKKDIELLKTLYRTRTKTVGDAILESSSSYGTVISWCRDLEIQKDNIPQEKYSRLKRLLRRAMDLTQRY